MSWTNLATEIFDKQSSRHQPASAKFSSAPTNVGVVAESMWITSDEFPAMCHGTGSRKVTRERDRGERYAARRGRPLVAAS